MDDEILKKSYEEIVALKDLFLRRLMDDKIKSAAIVRLKEDNEALQRQLDEKANISIVKDILLLCDRIDAQNTKNDLVLSIVEELNEILERREFSKMPPMLEFNPSYHNAVGTVEETDEYPEKSIAQIIKNGYFFRDTVFRPADVIVSVKKDRAIE